MFTFTISSSDEFLLYDADHRDSPVDKVRFSSFIHLITYFSLKFQGIARTQSPTTRNYALDLPTFGVIAGVNPTEVQLKGLALGDRPRRSPIPPCQVSMIYFAWLHCL